MPFPFLSLLAIPLFPIFAFISITDTFSVNPAEGWEMLRTMFQSLSSADFWNEMTTGFWNDVVLSFFALWS